MRFSHHAPHISCFIGGSCEDCCVSSRASRWRILKNNRGLNLRHTCQRRIPIRRTRNPLNQLSPHIRRLHLRLVIHIIVSILGQIWLQKEPDTARTGGKLPEIGRRNSALTRIGEI